MTRALIRPSIAVVTAGVLALMSACTMKKQEAPPFAGPSEFDQSITIEATPDQLNLDGASQSLVTVTARDGNAAPIRNLTMRVFLAVNGTPVDFGSISARSIVTGSDGRASVVYTAPPSPAVAPDPFTVVDVVVTPQGTDFNNAIARAASIRLYPRGIVVPGTDLVPAFTFEPTAPAENQAVLFNAGTSTGTITDYQWNFGDGGRGSGRTTQHTYNRAGTYIVTLTVADPYGRTEQTSQSVTVGAGVNPTAAFNFSPTSPLPSQQVFFNASASRPAPGRSIASYSWDFGDGTGGSGVTPSHTYGATGSYNVTLVVTDDAGRFGTVTQNVTIGAVGNPTALFTVSPTNAFPNQDVFFNATQSTASAGRTIVSYAWNFGDGTTGTGVQTSHRYATTGQYTATLVVTDDAGRVGTVTQGVAIGNDSPTAAFDFAPTAPTTVQVIAFNATASTAVAGRTIVSYVWNWGDGTPVGSGVASSHSYPTPGTRNVTLTVVDNTGKSGTLTKAVTVQ
jgi:PKD repeat protein